MIDKYKQAFQDEAREILLELESSLLELHERPSDTELVGRSFRALHTIKGSGAMFGFDQISAFTHHVENAFDQVRNGRMAATPELISLALASVDQIKGMLDEAAGEGSVDAATSVEILTKLRALTGTPQPQTAKPANTTPVNTPIPITGEAREWLLSFRPAPDLLRNGANPLVLFRELRQMGNLQIRADLTAMPALNEIDPQRCYLSWELVLTTAVSAEAIRDVFIFVEDNCELAIRPATPLPQAAASPAIAPPLERRSSEGRRGSARSARRAGRPARNGSSAAYGNRRPQRRSRHSDRRRGSRKPDR
jgi:two-component system, chemotaxis family, sensor kinase CheA